MPRARPHERFSEEVRLTPENVAAVASTLGDTNPIHHDRAVAAESRFGEPIASGPHASGLLMALSARHFAATGPMLGLDFAFRFKKAIPATATIRLEWLVIRCRHNARLGGDVVDLRGRIVDEAGTTAVGATGRVLLLDDER